LAWVTGKNLFIKMAASLMQKQSKFYINGKFPKADNNEKGRL